jgi:hypothetical protein
MRRSSAEAVDTPARWSWLSIEAYQPKLFAENLTSSEAAKRIENLKREIALANSF